MVRASILRANLRFAAVAAEHTRAPVEQLRPMIEPGPYGSAAVLASLVPSARPAVVWEAEPVVFHVGGLTETGIARSLGALVVLLDALEELGATHLRWG